MMTLRSVCGVLAVVLLFVSGAGWDDEPAALQPLTIETAKGRADFQVEVADTLERRQVGLMYRKELPERRGMLFLFHAPAQVSFWMLNTYIPLDILFIGDGGRIVQIAADTQPLSTDLIDSRERVIGALEINGGLAKKLGIAVGDVVHHAAFAPVHAQRP